MKLVTLITDWGLKDYYVASLKARLISLYPDVRIIDISHNIDHFDILQASYILSNCYDKFPEGTVHLIAVRRGDRKSQDNGYRLVKCKGHYFIGFDSGVFYLTLGDEPKEVFQLDIDNAVPQYIASDTLCVTATALMNGVDYKTLGTPTADVQKYLNTRPVLNGSTIRGTVIHIDSFANVFCNITKDIFYEIGKNRPFTVSIRGDHYDFQTVNTDYDDVKESELAVMFNEKGNLFVALNRSTAASLLGLKLFDTIRIDFKDR